jgi:hypothetical protein
MFSFPVYKATTSSQRMLQQYTVRYSWIHVAPENARGCEKRRETSGSIKTEIFSDKLSYH